MPELKNSCAMWWNILAALGVEAVIIFMKIKLLSKRLVVCYSTGRAHCSLGLTYSACYLGEITFPKYSWEDLHNNWIPKTTFGEMIVTLEFSKRRSQWMINWLHNWTSLVPLYPHDPSGPVPHISCARIDYPSCIVFKNSGTKIRVCTSAGQ